MANISIKPGVKAALVCNIFGYPTSTVQWSFFPCDNLAIDIKLCNKEYTNRRIFVSTRKNYLIE